MKKFLTLTTLLGATVCFAQNNIGIGTTTPHASARLEVSSINSGFLPPRMTSGQRTGIVSPAAGLQVYDTNTNSFWFYNGSAWTELPGGTGGTNFWSLGSGGSIYNNNSGKVMLGTSDLGPGYVNIKIPVNGTGLFLSETGTPVSDYFNMAIAAGGGTAATRLGIFLGSFGNGMLIVNQANAPMLFQTYNTEKMRITPAGFVGINTINPSSQLEVKTATGAAGITHTDGTIRLSTVLNSATSAAFGTTTNHALHFFTNNSAPQVTLSTTGNLGIGTQTPTGLLHIETGTTNKGLVVTGAFNNAAVIPDFIEGGRMMFYPALGAFRAGYANTSAWSNANIGLNSVALGTNTIAKGLYSTAFGNSTTATGDAATAMGSFTLAAGAIATAIGQGTLARGDNSTAMGYYSTAGGRYSTVMGLANISKEWSSTVVGAYNDTVIVNDETSQASYSPLFTVGNGTGTNARSNAMVVLNNGRVGVGTNTPAALLHVRSNSLPALPQVWIEESDNDFARLTFSNYAPTANYWTIAALPQATNSASVMNFFYKGFNNDVLSLRGDGTAWLAGSLTQNSDARLKTNILPISLSLSHLMLLEGYQYKWKDENRDQDIQFGLLAQEVQKVFPELVKKDANDMLGVNYNGFIPLLINSIKEQQYTIQTLEKRLSELEEKLK